MTSSKTHLAAITLAALTVWAVPVLAESARAQAAVTATTTSTTTTTPASAAEMTDAVVRKVDKAQGKLTLKHGPIRNLDMPGMTMVFSVRDKAALDKLQPGDKLKFTAVDEQGKLTVTDLIRTD
jgi:Cu(I)/Ag(I) efflux system periplasmic protein CusF